MLQILKKTDAAAKRQIAMFRDLSQGDVLHVTGAQPGVCGFELCRFHPI